MWDDMEGQSSEGNDMDLKGTGVMSTCTSSSSLSPPTREGESPSPPTLAILIHGLPLPGYDACGLSVGLTARVTSHLCVQWKMRRAYNIALLFSPVLSHAHRTREDG